MLDWVKQGFQRDFFLIFIIFVLSSILLLIHQLYFAFFTVDDSYISLRYAFNLANGDGLVFNPGERPVEGYTNFLWVLLITPFYFLSSNPFVGHIDYGLMVAKILGVLFTLVTLWITFLIANRYIKTTNRMHPLLTTLPIIFLALSGTYAYWAVCGMETPLFQFFFTLFVYLYLVEEEEKRFVFSGLALAGLALTRPEGFLIAIVVALFVFIKIAYESKKAGRLVLEDRYWKNILLFAIIASVYLLWKYSYYGALLPNTFAAKASGINFQFQRGLEYLGRYISVYPFLLLIPFTILFIRRNLVGVGMYALVMIYLLYILIIGGDNFRGFRFFTPLLPVMAILLVEAGYRFLQRLSSPDRTIRFIWISTLIVGGIVFLIYLFSQQTFFRQEMPDGFRGIMHFFHWGMLCLVIPLVLYIALLPKWYKAYSNPNTKWIALLIVGFFIILSLYGLVCLFEAQIDNRDLLTTQISLFHLIVMGYFILPLPYVILTILFLAFFPLTLMAGIMVLHTVQKPTETLTKSGASGSSRSNSSRQKPSKRRSKPSKSSSRIAPHTRSQRVKKTDDKKQEVNTSTREGTHDASAEPSAIPPIKRSLAVLMIGFLVLYLLFHLFMSIAYLHYPLSMTSRIAEVGRVVGTWLKEHKPTDYSISTNAAGAIPYFTQWKTMDSLGLNDLYIARRDVSLINKLEKIGKQTGGGHDKGWGWYTLNQAPDIVIFYNVSGNDQYRDYFCRKCGIDCVESVLEDPETLYKPIEHQYLSDGEIYDDPRFCFMYRPFRIPIRIQDHKYIQEVFGRPHGSVPTGNARFAFTDLGSFIRSYAESSAGMMIDGLVSELIMEDTIVLNYFEKTIGRSDMDL
jgi:hypothetical protein